MSTGLKRLNEQSYNPGLNGNVMNPLVNIPFKRQGDEVALSGVQTFTRVSTATYVDPLDGLVKTAAIDTPRFEKMSDGGTGILMEGASTNLALDSDRTNFRFGLYTKSYNTVISPDGTLTGTTITANSSNAYNVDIIATPIATQKTYTASVWIKATNIADIGLKCALFIYDSAVVEVVRKNFLIPATWTRISITQTFTSAVVNSNVTFRLDSRNTSSVIGESLDVWGAQFEALPFASSYIPTATAPVTRASDSLSILASGNVPQIMSQHTIIADAETFGIIPGAFQIIAGSISAVIPDMHDLRILQAGIPYAQSRFGDQLIANSVNPIIFNHVYRLAISNTGSSLVGYSDGEYIQASPAAVTSNIIPVSTFNIGSYLGGVGSLYGRIRNFRIYDRALTSAEVLVA